MATSNPTTGDKLVSKANTKAYEDNYDTIFNEGEDTPDEMEEIEVDIPVEHYPLYLSLGLRMGLLQGLFDVTYDEIFQTLLEKYEGRMARKNI
jgi:hypothetical protein